MKLQIGRALGGCCVTVYNNLSGGHQTRFSRLAGWSVVSIFPHGSLSLFHFGHLFQQFRSPKASVSIE